MPLYNDLILPRLCHCAMGSGRLAPYRRRIAQGAEGRVLEIGIGSGLNLPFYGAGVRAVIGLEPSAPLLAMSRAAAAQHAALPVQLIEGSAETIPLADASIDTIVTTWTLCSIPDVAAALAELRRVLTPTGRLLFVEHGLAPERNVQRWQHRLTPLWMRLAGGCHLDRATAPLIEGAGFVVDRIATGYLGRPHTVTFMSEGVARPR